MPAEYKTTYVVENRIITEVGDAAALVGDLIANNSYVAVVVNGIFRIFDMKRIAVTSTFTVDHTLTIEAFVTSHLTDFIVDALTTDDTIPLRGLYTHRFVNRIKCVDPHVDENYTVSYTSLRTPDIRDSQYHQSWANDLVITSPTEDLSNVLVAVNGLFHKTVLFGGELFVAGGYANMKRAGVTETALIDTTALGGHTVVNILEEHISPIGGAPLSQGLRLTLPDGMTFAGKTPVLVIHGQMFLLDGTHRIITPNVLRVDMNKMDIPHLIMHHPMTKWSRQYRAAGFIYPYMTTPSNENELPAVYDDENPLYANPIDANGIVDTSALLTDQAITDLLTAGQSFLVLLNETNIYLKKYRMTPTTAPSEFELRRDDTPRGLLMYNGSWVLPYTIRSSKDRQHTVTVAARRLGDDLYRTMLDQTMVEAPWFDPRDTQRKPTVELIEMYRV